MSEQTNTPAENTATATIDETTLSPTVREMLSLIRNAVAEAERVQPRKDKRSAQDILISLVLDGTDEDVKGLEAFRNVLRAKAQSVFEAEQSETGEVSEEERGKVRKESKAAYDSAMNVIGLLGGLPEGFVLPTFPGARGGSNAGAGLGGEKPRNLKHTVTEDGKDTPLVSDVTFAVIAQKTKESTADLLAQFKSVAGQTKDEWENGPGQWEWAFSTGEGENKVTYNVVTKYTAPAS